MTSIVRAERLADPPLLTAFPFTLATRLLAPGDIRATAVQRDAYLRYTRIGDPLADAVVEMIRRLPAGHGRQMFETALEHGIDALVAPPPELVALFNHVDATPYWVNSDELDLGCRVIARTGVLGDLALVVVALMGGYLASRVCKTLVGTGKLTRTASQRLTETRAWHCAVTTPKGLERDATGFKTTVRVRLMHATVRAGLARKPGWDFDKWDHPINQSQVAGTTMLFALAALTGSQALGFHFSPTEKNAVYHLWRYIGYLLGVDPNILPATESDAWRMLWLQADYEFRAPDADSIRLARALIVAIRQVTIGDGHHLLHHIGRAAATGITCAYARLILGKHYAEFLELPDNKPWQLAVLVGATCIKLLEYPRRLLPGATQLSEACGQRSRRVAMSTAPMDSALRQAR